MNETGEEFENDPNMEQAWAMRAVEHARIYMNILIAVDCRGLRLSRFDDEIYAHFRKDFADFQLEYVTEESLKSDENKTKWRNFAECYAEKLEDYNFGALLRLDANGVYDEENTIFVTKIQFLAVEIARNREGVNSTCKAQFAPKILKSL